MPPPRPGSPADNARGEAGRTPPRPTIFDVDDDDVDDDVLPLPPQPRRAEGEGHRAEGGAGGRGGGSGGGAAIEAVAQQLVAIFPNMSRLEALGRARQAEGSIERAVDVILSSGPTPVGSGDDDGPAGGFVRSEVLSVGGNAGGRRAAGGGASGPVVRRRWW